MRIVPLDSPCIYVYIFRRSKDPIACFFKIFWLPYFSLIILTNVLSHKSWSKVVSNHAHVLVNWSSWLFPHETHDESASCKPFESKYSKIKIPHSSDLINMNLWFILIQNRPMSSHSKFILESCVDFFAHKFLRSYFNFYYYFHNNTSLLLIEPCSWCVVFVEHDLEKVMSFFCTSFRELVVATEAYHALTK